MTGNLYHNVRAQWLLYGVFFVVLAAVPWMTDDGFLLNRLSTYGVYGLLALSISLCWGFGGILNLGQGMAFGLAAYGMAMTMQLQAQDRVSDPVPPFMLNNSLEQLPMFWEPFWHPVLGIALAIVLPTLFYLVFGGIMFRSRVSGPFFAIMSLALLSAWATLILDVQPYTNGANGITPPRPLEVLGVTVDPYGTTAYWLIWAVLLACTVGAKLLTQSKFGLVVQAVRSDPERVRFLGYSVAMHETLIYVFSGLIASIAGCCWVILVQYVSPAQLDVSFSISMVIWAGIGGRLSLLGSILGAYGIQGAQSTLGETFLNSWLLVLGLFFVLVVRFLPNGFAGLLESLLARAGRRPGRGDGAPSTSGVAPTAPSPSPVGPAALRTATEK